MWRELKFAKYQDLLEIDATVCRAQHANAVIESLCTKALEQQIASDGDMKSIPTTSFDFVPLCIDKQASRVCEKLVSVVGNTDMDAIERFYQLVLRGNLRSLALDAFGNFVLQALLRQVRTAEMATDCLDELLPHLDEIGKQERHGVITCIVQAAAQAPGAGQSEVIKVGGFLKFCIFTIFSRSHHSINAPTSQCFLCPHCSLKDVTHKRLPRSTQIRSISIRYKGIFL
jgi:hypothetical protein